MEKKVYIRNKYYKLLLIGFFIERAIKRMTKRTVDFLEDFVQEKEKIVDIGAGGGWISQEMQKRKKTENTLVDVINLNQTDLPVILYDGENIPFRDNTFDTALLISVLHHCENPSRVLLEAKRVVKNKIIVMEDIAKTPFGEVALRFKDAVTNIGFCLMANSFREMINLPFHFKKISGWEQIFKDLNLQIVYKKEFRPFLNHHSIGFILKK